MSYEREDGRGGRERHSRFFICEGRINGITTAKVNVSTRHLVIEIEK